MRDFVLNSNHNKLLLPLASNNIFLTSHMIRPLALTNYGIQWVQITSLWFFKYCDSWAQQTVMASEPNGRSDIDNEL